MPGSDHLRETQDVAITVLVDNHADLLVRSTDRYPLPAHRVTFEFDFCLLYGGRCQHIVQLGGQVPPLRKLFRHRLYRFL